MSADLVKVTVNLTRSAYEALEAAANAEAHTRTDVINRALRLYEQIGAAPSGVLITVTNHDGTAWKRVVIQ